MSNVRISWVLPTTRVDGRPLEVLHTRIEMKVDGAPSFTEINTITPDVAQTLLLADVDPGSYAFRGITVDLQGLESAPAEGSIVVPNALPGSPQTFSVDLE